MLKIIFCASLVFEAVLSSCSTVPQKPDLGRELYDMASTGKTQDVASLLDKGAPIDELNNGMTALSVATYYGHANAVKILLDRGANIDKPSIYNSGPGPTALSYAAMRHSSSIAKLMIEKGGNIQLALDGLESLVNANSRYLGTGPAQNIQAYNEASAGIKFLESFRKGNSVVDPGLQDAKPAFQVAQATLAPNFSGIVSPDDYAVVIGIDKYPDLPAAAYAERDAIAMKNFIHALGVPDRNIVLLTGNRATKTGMEKTIEAWLPNNVSSDSRVYFYYSGHGAPDTKTGDAYLVPSDGDPQYLAQTGYPLKRLYEKLGQLRVKRVLVALDSCFSGAGGRSVLAKGTRPLVGKVDVAVQPNAKLFVISASASDQISGADEEAGYGLFTFNLLQGLNGAAKDAQGHVTLKSLYGYVKPRVQDEARRNNRDQTPQLQTGDSENLILRVK